MDCFTFHMILSASLPVYTPSRELNPLITEYWGPDSRMVLAATLYFLHQDKDRETFYTLSPLFTGSGPSSGPCFVAPALTGKWGLETCRASVTRGVDISQDVF